MSKSSCAGLWILFLFGCCLSLISAPEAKATESGQSLYLAGSKGQGAGILPPEGYYFSNPFYLYNGDASGSFTFGGLVASASVEVDAKAFFPTGIWVTPVDVLGGDLAVGVTMPVGWVDVEAAAVAAIPALGLSASASTMDSFGGFGDPLLTGSVGWHEGNSHWNVTTLVNVPIGDYDQGELANLSLNRWAADVTGAYTWLDPEVGLDLSVAAGVTFNGTNNDTQYDSGHEFHLEVAASQFLNESVAIGVNVFHGEQFTGDSGAGARLGAFKGRVTAIGPEVNAIVPLGNVPAFINVRWMEEIEVTNRLKGRTAWFTMTVPLGGGPSQ
jgi:hypothetical protein